MKKITVTIDEFVDKAPVILSGNIGLDRYIVMEGDRPKAVFISATYFDLLTESLELLAKMVSDESEDAPGEEN